MSFPRYESYRDSGLEWLGEVPAHWQVEPIRALAKPGRASFVDGDWVEAPFITDEGVRLIQTGNIGVGRYKEQGYRYVSEQTFKDLQCTEVLPGDILICRLAEPVGRACLAPDLGCRMITSVDVCVLKPRATVTPPFLTYFFSSPEYLGFMEGQCRGGTRDRVSRTFLGNVRVMLPPPAEQVAIAAFLNRETAKIDALVEEQRRLIELLNEKRKAVISRAVAKGLNPSAPMKDSGVEWLGSVPAHWKVLKARRLFIERDERSVTGNEELLTVSHLTGVTPRSEKKVNMIEAETTEGYKLCEAGDLVINTLWAWMGAMGTARQGGLVSPAYNVYSPAEGVVPGFVDLLVRTPAFVTEVNRYSKGVWSSRLRLYPESFFQLALPVPPADEQAAIVNRLAELTGGFEALSEELERGLELLQERRAALISAAVTGKIDVREPAAASAELEPA